MSDSICKVLFLKVPGADEGFERDLRSGLPQGDVAHEVHDLAAPDYDAILDGLEPGVLPVVLRPSIVGGGAA